MMVNTVRRKGAGLEKVENSTAVQAIARDSLSVRANHGKTNRITLAPVDAP
jgi:hypothetical protein